MTFRCMICCEDSLYFCVGDCEHAAACLRCTVKLRELSSNQRCIVCNKELEEVAVLSDQSLTFRAVRHLLQEFQ